MTDYERITTRIRREMNGAVSGSMRSLSPHNQRKINFGVSLPTIKDICKEYDKSHDLANELRGHSVREWWLAAAFVDEPKKITLDEANRISDSWINMEESDIYATYLLFNIKDAINLVFDWLKSESPLKVNAAEKITLKLASSISDDEAKKVLELTSSEVPVRAIYQSHQSLRSFIKSRGPYPFSWILDEIDNM